MSSGGNSGIFQVLIGVLAAAAAAVVSGFTGLLTYRSYVSVPAWNPSDMTIGLSKDNNFAYMSDGLDIQMYSRDLVTGALTNLIPATIRLPLPCPQNMEVMCLTISQDLFTPKLHAVYGQAAGNVWIATFSINPSTGALTFLCAVWTNLLYSQGTPISLSASAANTGPVLYLAVDNTGGGFGATQMFLQSQYILPLGTVGAAGAPAWSIAPPVAGVNVRPYRVRVSPDLSVAFVFYFDNPPALGYIARYAIQPDGSLLYMYSSPATTTVENGTIAFTQNNAPGVFAPYAYTTDGFKLGEFSIDPATLVLTPLSPALVAIQPFIGEPTDIGISIDGLFAYVCVIVAANPPPGPYFIAIYDVH
jgi:hypothetical protein